MIAHPFTASRWAVVSDDPAGRLVLGTVGTRATGLAWIRRLGLSHGRRWLLTAPHTTHAALPSARVLPPPLDSTLAVTGGECP